MEHLIDKDALVAEIEDLEDRYKKCPTRNSYEEGLKDGRLIGYKDALHKIDTLEVKESEDLEEIFGSMADEYLNKVLIGECNMTEQKAHQCRLSYYLGLKSGSNWQKQQFEKNRLAACDAQTEQEANIEQDFVIEIIKNAHRQPTFDDAIKYGMRLQKEQMMEKAIDGEVGYWNLHGLSVNVELPHSVEEGDKVKVIVIKED